MEQEASCGSCSRPLPQGSSSCPHCEPQTLDFSTGYPEVPGYRVLRLIGQGGMGTVFLAEDLTLFRKVAIKVISGKIAHNEGMRARFLREARSMATLEHPNVARIYAFGEAQNTAYIVMEYIEGESLADRLRRVGRLDCQEAFFLLRQVLDALKFAWELQIVHRDIKPSNILLDKRNQVRVVDFGLAKSTQTDGVDTVTGTGAFLGSPHYVSPEQARGEAVDFRTDIYSLGIVLYEMLSGKKPFGGTTPFAIVAGHLHEALPSIRELRPDVPEEIAYLLRVMTSKSPAGRHASYEEILETVNALLGTHAATPTMIPGYVRARPRPREAFRKLPVFLVGLTLLLIAMAFLWQGFRPPSGSQDRTTAAVADFVNETGEKGLDGLSGMLITSLEQSRRLSVLTRSRMLDILKRSGKGDAQRIDEALGREICVAAKVHVLILAAVRKFGQLYTIDLQAVDPHRNEYLFAAKESGQGQESIPGMIDQLSEKIRAAMREKSNEIESSRQKISELTTKNLEAYECYFQGEQLLNSLRLQEAEEQFQKAIDLDPTFVLGYYRLAYVLNWLESERALDPMRKAMRLLEKAPEKERLLISAFNAHIEGRNAEAIQIYSDALKLYPKEKEALYNLGDLAFHNGDYQTALSQLNKVLDLDPTEERALEHVVWTYESLAQFDRMLEYAKQYVGTVPSESAYLWLGDAHNARADFHNAHAAYRDGLQLYPDSATLLKGIGHTYILMNQFTRAERQFRQMAEDPGPLADQREGYRGLALVHAYLGKYRDALRMTDRVIEIDLSLGDTTDLARAYAMKAYWLMAAGKPEDEVREAIKRGTAFKKVADWFFFGPLFDSYLMMGDFQNASYIAGEELSWGAPFLNISVQAYVQRNAGDYDAAIKEFRQLIDRGRGHDRLLGWHNLALCYLEVGRTDEAVSAAQRIQNLFPNISDHYLGRRALFYPRSFYILGRAYEKTGKNDLAAENYTALLDLWEKADPGIPELQQAREGLERLR